MTSAILAIQNAKNNVQSRVESIDLPSINWRAVCVCGFFVLFSLLLFYVWQINDLTKGYYLTSDYERQIEEFSLAKKELEISFAENSFMDQALLKIQALNFQKAMSIKYLQISKNPVVFATKGSK